MSDRAIVVYTSDGQTRVHMLWSDVLRELWNVRQLHAPYLEDHFPDVESGRIYISCDAATDEAIEPRGLRVRGTRAAVLDP